MKKFGVLTLGLTLGLSIFATIPSTSLAQEFNGENQGVIDLNNIEKLEKTGEITTKEVTYEEMINDISQSKGISKEKAKELHPNQVSQKALSNNKTLAQGTVQDSSTTLHEINIRQNVTSTYRPAIQLFVWTYNSGSFTQFIEMEEMDLDRKDIVYDTSKQYQGKLRAEIQSSGTKIWWYINGDFYNNGTTTISGTVSANGVVWSGEGSISEESNHFKYWNNDGTYSRYGY